MTTPRITQDMIRLYDEYTHLTLDRRGFMEKLTALTGSGAAAATIATLIGADSARAAQTAPDDPRLATGPVSFQGEGGAVKGYLARPKAAGKYGAVVVIHENRGLNAHIEDVARRLALGGFLVLAPDFLSPLGGTPPDEDKARDLFPSLDPLQTVKNAGHALAFLKTHDAGNGKVGAVGFCWGGGLVNAMAVSQPDLKAGVAYYGVQPDPKTVPAIKARLLLHYAGLDERIDAGIPAYEAALKAARVDYRLFVYAGVNHAFNNDTAAARYDKAAADLAWSRTLAFLKESLA